jgi:hypothetical protein
MANGIIIKAAARRACLSGKEMADLLNGECVSVDGVDFVFDGDGFRDVNAAFENYRKRAGKSSSSRYDPSPRYERDPRSVAVVNSRH